MVMRTSDGLKFGELCFVEQVIGNAGVYDHACHWPTSPLGVYVGRVAYVVNESTVNVTQEISEDADAFAAERGIIEKLGRHSGESVTEYRSEYSGVQMDDHQGRDYEIQYFERREAAGY